MSEVTAPDFFSVDKALEQRDVNIRAADAVAALKGVATIPSALPDGYRIFLSPHYPNAAFLATAGKPRVGINPAAPMGVEPLAERRGDVWVKFDSGVCATDEVEVIKWLEAHSGDQTAHGDYHRAKNEDVMCGNPYSLCREQGPGSDVWAELKLGQMDIMTRNKTIDPSLDVEALMRGDYATGAKQMKTGAGAAMRTAADNSAAAAKERVDGLA